MEQRMNSGQCCFCSDEVDSTNAINSEENNKIYQDIYECAKYHMKDEYRGEDFFDWKNCTGSLSPFCSNCFKSAQKIHRVSQELEIIKENLIKLLEKFKIQIKSRTSKNTKKKTKQSSSTVEHNSPHIEEIVLKPEIDFIEDVDEDISDVYVENKFSIENETFKEEVCYTIDDTEMLENATPENDFDAAGQDHDNSDLITRDIDEENKTSNSGHWPHGDRTQSRLERVEAQSSSIVASRADTKSVKRRKQIFTTSVNEKKLPFRRDSQRLEQQANPKISSNVRSADEPCAKKRKQTVMAATNNERIYSNPSALHVFDLAGTYIMSTVKSNLPTISSVPTVMAPTLPVYINGVEMKSTNNVLNCRICGKPCETLEDLILHEVSHNGEHEKPFICSMCNKGFNFLHILKLHACEGVPKIDKIYDCKTCGKHFTSNSLLIEHLLVHRTDKGYACLQCDKKFKLPDSLVAHEAAHEQKKFLCELCAKAFSSLSYLRQHKMDKHGKEENRKKFKCEICGNKFFASMPSLISHQKREHTVQTGNDPITCHKCKNQVEDLTALFVHNQRLAKDIRYKCSFCTELFYSCCDLLMHMAKDHPAEKLPYQCKDCPVVCSSRNTFNKHLRSKHGIDLSNKECDLCGKLIASNYFKYHRGLHVGPNFICKFCGKGMNTKKYFLLHEQRCENEQTSPS